jgi:hypothetical protein
VPLFQDAGVQSSSSKELAAPVSYATIDYQQAIPVKFESKIQFEILDKSEINAIRFITKNLLAILPEERRSIDWHNQHLLLPLQSPIHVQAGNTLEIQFSYDAGGPIEMLEESMQCKLLQI